MLAGLSVSPPPPTQHMEHACHPTNPQLQATVVPELAQLASHAGTAGDGQEVGWDT